MDAIDKYDPTRDNKFKTYAEFRIRGAILDELRAQDWVPRSVRDKAKLLDRTMIELEAELGRGAQDEEIATKLNMTMDEFYDLLNQVRPVSVLSIDEAATFSSVDKKSILNLLEATKMNNPFTQLNMKSVKDIVTKAIEELPERQRLGSVVVLLRRFEFERDRKSFASDRKSGLAASRSGRLETPRETRADL